MNKISIPQKPPRDLKEYKERINFQKGLGGYYFYYYLMIFFGFGLFLVSFFPPYEIGLIIFKLFGAIFFGGIGIYLLLGINKKLNSRKTAFKNGILVEALITKHKKIFVPWKSARDYIIEIEFKNSKGEVLRKNIQSSKNIFSILPINSKTKVVFEEKTNSIFIPIEMGIEI